MAFFECNLENTRIKNIQFVAGKYQTDDPAEIELLRNYGAQQGCIVKEYAFPSEPPTITEIVDDIEVTPPKKKAKAR